MAYGQHPRIHVFLMHGACESVAFPCTLSFDIICSCRYVSSSQLDCVERNSGKSSKVSYTNCNLRIGPTYTASTLQAWTMQPHCLTYYRHRATTMGGSKKNSETSQHRSARDPSGVQHHGFLVQIDMATRQGCRLANVRPQLCEHFCVNTATGWQLDGFAT